MLPTDKSVGSDRADDFVERRLEGAELLVEWREPSKLTIFQSSGVGVAGLPFGDVDVCERCALPRRLVVERPNEPRANVALRGAENRRCPIPEIEELGLAPLKDRERIDQSYHDQNCSATLHGQEDGELL